jgi:hypothetical protein
MVNRFAIRTDQAGCTVFDTLTGLPAAIETSPQNALTFEEAETTAEILNRAHGVPVSTQETWSAILAECEILNRAHGAPVFDQETWSTLLADCWRANDAIARFFLSRDGVLERADVVELDRLCELERRARDQVEIFLKSLK